MAGVKISALPAVGAALLTDFFPVVQAGVTSRETVQQVVTLFNSNIQLASAAQVTGLNATLATFLPLAGGTMAGPLILHTNSPATALEAASKGYVDTVASGFTVILACLVATTANLNAVYANGASGVGATLTDNSGTFAAFTVDGQSPALNSRVLVKNQTNTFENGVYSLTTNGDTISVPWVLTRTTDYDSPAEIQPGTLIAVNTGTVNANTSWLQTATVTTVGTDPVLFSQFTFAPSSFLMVANNLSDVASAATSRTNLGLGTAATKTASDNTKTIVSMVNGATTVGHTAIFSDITGTIEDGGVPLSLILTGLANGRLTLSSGVPVTTSDVTAATTLYFTPFTGNQIALFDGVSVWTTSTFTDLSIQVPGTGTTMYDVFVYDNASVPTLELQTWINDTTRNIAIVLQDGVYVKSSDTTRRYVGSFRTTGTVGQTEDSIIKRYLWNYYNRMLRLMRVIETTDTWNYSIAAFRQVNANAANQLDFVVGVSEDIVSARCACRAVNSAAVNVLIGQGIGLDSTTVNSAVIMPPGTSAHAAVLGTPQAWYEGFPGVGRHLLVWLERGAGVNTQTWQGDNATPTFVQHGIQGHIFA